MANNQLKVLVAETFNDLDDLVTLNLSMNALVNIEKTTFMNLTKLKVLDVSANELHGVSLVLPDNLKILQMGNNSLRLWPFVNIPKNLTYLDLHGNELNELFPEHDAVPNLKVIHIFFRNKNHSIFFSLYSTLIYPEI